jgi:hypothetical protein
METRLGSRLVETGQIVRGASVFTFSHHPTAIGVSDGIQDAFQYLQTSWRIWLPVVGVIAALALVTHTLVGSLDPTTLYHQDLTTGRVVWNPDALGKLTWAIVARLVDGLIAGIGGWFFYATAIAGLRNRPVTLAGVIGRGLTTVLSGLFVAAVAMVTLTGLLAVGLAVTIVAPPAGRLLIIVMATAGIPAAIYVVVRLTFTGLAIFDGFGPIAGIQESWRVSQGSVLRLLGWGALAFLMTIGISILAGIVVTPFSGSGLSAVAEAAATAISVTGSALVVFMMAVLYESERARKDPTLYPVPAWPGYGSGPGMPYVQGPYPARPYTPGPYTAGPYAGGPYPTAPYGPGPYPTDPTGVPGWTGPTGAGPAWPAPPPYAPGPYPGNPAAMTGWVAPGPAPAWAADPANQVSANPADSGPNQESTGSSKETGPAPQTPSAPPPAEPPAS